jgi:hypothetical protein
VVVAATGLVRFITCETVVIETPARFATSAIVTVLPGLRPDMHRL